nr:uncharacterized protein LOC103421049 [Malus domestica]XP_028958145.1 uncharacterized protein LOC103421049 [Malus domestica]
MLNGLKGNQPVESRLLAQLITYFVSYGGLTPIFSLCYNNVILACTNYEEEANGRKRGSKAASEKGIKKGKKENRKIGKRETLTERRKRKYKRTEAREKSSLAALRREKHKAEGNKD